MEVAILNILKGLASPDTSGLEYFMIIAIILVMLLYKYFMKPYIDNVSKAITAIQNQNENLTSVSVIVERLETNISSLVKSSDENFKVNQLMITESQKDIDEIKNILSQFQGALMYNSRLFNKELE